MYNEEIKTNDLLPDETQDYVAAVLAIFEEQDQKGKGSDETTA